MSSFHCLDLRYMLDRLVAVNFIPHATIFSPLAYNSPSDFSCMYSEDAKSRAQFRIGRSLPADFGEVILALS